MAIGDRKFWGWFKLLQPFNTQFNRLRLFCWEKSDPLQQNNAIHSSRPIHLKATKHSGMFIFIMLFVSAIVTN